MRLIFELWDRYFQMETGRIVDDPTEDEDVEAEEEVAEIIRLPLGFQAPPVTVEDIGDDEDDEDESEAPEADCG
jgi:hypothetical protein